MLDVSGTEGSQSDGRCAEAVPALSVCCTAEPGSVDDIRATLQQGGFGLALVPCVWEQYTWSHQSEVRASHGLLIHSRVWLWGVTALVIPTLLLACLVCFLLQLQESASVWGRVPST